MSFLATFSTSAPSPPSCAQTSAPKGTLLSWNSKIASDIFALFLLSSRTSVGGDPLVYSPLPLGLPVGMHESKNFPEILLMPLGLGTSYTCSTRVGITYCTAFFVFSKNETTDAR